MGMKLLAKSEVDRAKATEQRVAVDEGLKLARRVDNLREIQAQEEASLEKFRRETIAYIHEEITQEAAKLETLKGETSSLEDQHRKLKEPLDSEWAKLHAAVGVLDARTEAAGQREHTLTGWESELSEAQQEINKQTLRAQGFEELATQHLKDSETTLAQVTQTRLEATQERDALRFVRGEETQKVLHSAEAVKWREDGVMIREKDLATREKELADGWRLLKDREALLERNIKRFNK